MRRLFAAIVDFIVDVLETPLVRFIAVFVALFGLFKLLELLQ